MERRHAAAAGGRRPPTDETNEPAAREEPNPIVRDLHPCARPGCDWWLASAAASPVAVAVAVAPTAAAAAADASLPEALAMVREAYARLEAEEENPSRFASGAARLAAIALQITRLQAAFRADANAADHRLDPVLARLFAGLDDAAEPTAPRRPEDHAVPRPNGGGEPGLVDVDPDDWLAGRVGFDLGDDAFD